MATGYYTHPSFVQHEMGAGHPESPDRLRAIQEYLMQEGIWPQLQMCDAPAATEAHLVRAHDVAYLDNLQAHAPKQGYVALDPDTVMNPHTWAAALHAAGAVVHATDQVLEQRLDNAFCAVRPPGHHACRGQAMGFCFLNNLAIGVCHALQFHGLQRVAIVDFDVHHGNGTEDILAQDARVFMTGFFQHPFYPYSGTDQRGKNMVNVPLPAGTTGALVRQTFENTVIPCLDAFAPQMIFISAGFDAHRNDSLGQMTLVESDYAWMTEHIMRVARKHAQGRIVSTLEGGYTLNALAHSVAAHVQILTQG